MRNMLAPSGSILALSLVVTVYAISHVLPVTRVMNQVAHGWQASCAVAQVAAEMLWRGQPEWLWIFGWLPNPLLWFGVACLWIGRRRDARRAGVAAGLAGCLALAAASLWFFNAGLNDDLFSGYYVWASSMGMLALLGFWSAAAAKPTTPTRTASLKFRGHNPA